MGIVTPAIHAIARHGTGVTGTSRDRLDAFLRTQRNQGRVAGDGHRETELAGKIAAPTFCCAALDDTAMNSSVAQCGSTTGKAIDGHGEKMRSTRVGIAHLP